MRLFRERLLARLIEKHAISGRVCDEKPLVTSEARLPGRDRFVIPGLDGQQAVIYKGLKHNPTLGRNFETMGPLEWLARMADQIPDWGKHRTLFYSYYANRVRGDRAAEEPGDGKVEEEPAKKRRCTASWPRLIAKVFHTGPLTCRNCGAKFKIVAYLHDTVGASVSTPSA